MSLKFHSHEPEQLPPEWQAAISNTLEKRSSLRLHQAYVRKGCTQLLLELGPDAAEDENWAPELLERLATTAPEQWLEVMVTTSFEGL